MESVPAPVPVETVPVAAPVEAVAPAPLAGGAVEEVPAIEGGGKKMSRKRLVARAKKMCVKANGSNARIRASLKAAKKGKSATKARCGSKKNKARRASRKSARKAAGKA